MREMPSDPSGWETTVGWNREREHRIGLGGRIMWVDPPLGQRRKARRFPLVRGLQERRARPYRLCPHTWLESMALLDFLSPDAVVPALRANSKKQVLQELSAHAAKLTGLDERTVFEALLQRERLGST